jgi:hypothetical protein
MFRSFRRLKSSRPRLTRQPRSPRRLFESLEPRLALDGTVLVAIVANQLQFTGDADANSVEISNGPNPGEFLVTGLNGTSIDVVGNPSKVIAQPFNTVLVNLAGSSDRFSVKGASAQNRVTIPGGVQINNSGGDDVNHFEHAVLAANLNVNKAAGGGTNLSTLEIVGSEISAAVNVNNVNGANQGPSKTLIIQNSHLHNGFNLTNGNGKDILVVDQSNITGNVNVNHDGGETRTFFGQSLDPVIFGNLNVATGPGNDEFVLNETTVHGNVNIDNNGAGNTKTIVSDSVIGFGLPAAAGNLRFSLDNDLGFDQFIMTGDSEIRDGLRIRTDVANPANLSGSSIQIVASSRVLGNAAITTDAGANLIDLNGVQIGRNLTVNTGNGVDDITLTAVTIGLNLTINTNGSGDEVTLSATTVNAQTNINLGAGTDVLRLLDATRLLGLETLNGGAPNFGDRLEREVATVDPPGPTVINFEDIADV